MTIWRTWSVLFVVLLGGTWLLAFPYSPRPISESGTVINIYRAMGIVPEAGEMTMSDEIGHEVFELPPEDEKYLKEEMAAMGMSDMQMEDTEKDEDHAEDAKKEGEQMAGMDMKKEDEEEEEEGRGGSVAEGIQILATGKPAEIDAKAKALGVTKTMSLNMMEWGYEQGMIMGKPGDVIRLKIKNTGKIPHEFMIMNGATMNAINYRQRRADWNLVEHENLAEIAVMMPGDTVDMVVQLHKDGTWMFMCMFPYHMQMGMMGMISTPEAMKSGGGMNMNM